MSSLQFHDLVADSIDSPSKNYSSGSKMPSTHTVTSLSELSVFLDQISGLDTSLMTLNVAFSSQFNSKDTHKSNIEHLIELLSRTTCFLTIDLSCCSINDKDALSIASLCSAKKSTLHTLDLSGNDLTDAGLRELSSVFKGSQIRELNLRLNASISDEGCIALSKSLSDMNSLLSLDLSGNLISVAGARALAEGISGCSALARLELYANPLGDGGAAILSRVPATPLRVLNMWGCGLGELTASAVGTALQSQILRVLFLGNNSMGNPLGQRVGEALGDSKLEELDIGANHITGLGVQAICTGLGANKTLVSLSIRGNDIGQDMCSSLIHSARRHPKLRRLNVAGNATPLADSLKPLMEGATHVAVLADGLEIPISTAKVEEK